MAGMPVDVPNATVVMVLGICSIVICTLGPVLGTVALVIGNKSRKQYALNPAGYSESSYKQLNTGRICGIIGLCIGILSWLFIIAYVIFVYYMVTKATQEMEETLRQMPH